jgi:hypothetical protein
MRSAPISVRAAWYEPDASGSGAFLNDRSAANGHDKIPKRRFRTLNKAWPVGFSQARALAIIR